MLESLLSSLAFINIRSRNIPAHNLSMFVAHRIETNQKPAITPIRCLHPQLQLVSGATGASTIGMSARRPFSVIRMNEPTGAKKPSGCLPSLFKTKADVIERNAVGIKTFATRSEYSNKLRNEVDYLTELCFLFPDLSFCPLAVFNVGDDAIPFDDVAGFISQRHAPHQVPAIFPICAAETPLILKRLAAGNAREPLAVVSLNVIGGSYLMPA